jgi:hypothetical protein
LKAGLQKSRISAIKFTFIKETNMTGKKASATIKFHIISAMTVCLILSAVSIGQAKDGWKQADKILSRIQAPTFPDRYYNITD